MRGSNLALPRVYRSIATYSLIRPSRGGLDCPRGLRIGVPVARVICNIEDCRPVDLGKRDLYDLIKEVITCIFSRPSQAGVAPPLLAYLHVLNLNSHYLEMQSWFTDFVHIQLSCGVVLTAEVVYIYPAVVGVEARSNRLKICQTPPQPPFL